nr:putative integron gene cassette protein [uncultured bacterium]CAP48366.1 putative integron gene cassette protein [uncultured bacterium]
MRSRSTRNSSPSDRPRPGTPDVHQAVPLRTLASFLGSSRFARRRTPQQALPRVPTCECEIFTKAVIAFREALAGKSKGWSTA